MVLLTWLRNLLSLGTSSNGHTPAVETPAEGALTAVVDQEYASVSLKSKACRDKLIQAAEKYRKVITDRKTAQINLRLAPERPTTQGMPPEHDTRAVS